jgi:hypothetical protein
LGDAAWPDATTPPADTEPSERVRELEALHLENELLRRALRQGGEGGFSAWEKWQVILAAPQQLCAGLTLAGACDALALNRGSTYRWRAQPRAGEVRPRGRPPVQDAALAAAVEEIILAQPGYGRPRMTMELRRQQYTVNSKRVQRVLREGGWLQIRRRRKVRTTNSEHGYDRYPNLVANCGWRELDGPNQARSDVRK